VGGAKKEVSYDLRKYSSVDIRLLDISKMCVWTMDDDPSIGGNCICVGAPVEGGDVAANG